MKNNTFKIIWLLSYIWIMTSAVSVAAQQNKQYEIAGLSTKGSIIVEYQDSIDIVYNDNGSKAFLYIDRLNLSVTEAIVSDLDFITDMEILGDIVCFCGSMRGRQGMGWFEINDLFFAFGQVSFLPIPLAPSVYGYTGQLSLRKLEIYAPSPYDAHVFVLGDMVFGGGTLAPDQTYLFNLYYDGSWRIYYVFDAGGVYRFDDLAVTANHLMVVGHKDGSGDYSHDAATLAPSTANPLNTFLAMYSSNYQDYYPISRPLIEYWNNDSYIIASHGMFEENPGVVYSYYTSPGALIYRWMVPNVTTTTEFRDLKWKSVPNSENEPIFLVPDHNNTVVKNELYVSDISYNAGVLMPSKMKILHSLDCSKSNDDGAIVSGQTGDGYLGVWEAFYTNDNCATENPLPSLGAVHNVVEWNLDIDYGTLSSIPETYTTVINAYTLDIICE